MSKRNAGIVLVIAGVVVLALSLLADSLGLGRTTGMFGYKQIIGTVVGAIFAIAGVVLARR